MKHKKKDHASRSSTAHSRRAVVLDAFTQRDLETWDTRSIDAQLYSDRVYFDLERQRAARYEDLCAALAAAPAIQISVAGWVRVTDWRWNLTPLSPAGSLKGIGGRFNVGSDLDRARGQAFPCLYIAHDMDTAYREYFGGPLNTAGRLALQESALRHSTSFTTFALQGQLENVFDLRDQKNLNRFARIIATFDVSADTRKFVRKVRLAPRKLIKTPQELWLRLIAPPAEWRGEPQMFGIPAASQIFGRFVRDAGFEALLYPSQRGGATCLAVFPENFRGSNAHIEVAGTSPPEAQCIALNKNHLCLEGLAWH
jgi:hypothetical protein